MIIPPLQNPNLKTGMLNSQRKSRWARPEGPDEIQSQVKSLLQQRRHGEPSLFLPASLKCQKNFSNESRKCVGKMSHYCKCFIFIKIKQISISFCWIIKKMKCRTPRLPGYKLSSAGEYVKPSESNVGINFIIKETFRYFKFSDAWATSNPCNSICEERKKKKKEILK